MKDEFDIELQEEYDEEMRAGRGCIVAFMIGVVFWVIVIAYLLA